MGGKRWPPLDLATITAGFDHAMKTGDQRKADDMRRLMDEWDAEQGRA